MSFKEIIESYGKMLSFNCTAYTSGSAKYRTITENNIISANFKFDGALYTSVMRCMDFVFEGDLRGVKKDFYFKNCSLTATKENESATINYGTFIVAEAPEFDDVENTTKFICYDKMYLTMRPFTLKLSYPIKLKDFTKAILDECGLTCANLDELRNGDMYVKSEQFINVANDEDEEGTSPYTYRDALDNVARSAGCSFVHKSNANGESVDVLYVVYITDGNGNMKEPLHTLDISNFKTLTIGEKYGPANAVIFSRQPQEDNVYLKAEGITSENTIEVKLTQPLTAEGTDEERKAWLPEILKAVKGTEYQCYSLESYGIGYLNFGDVFKIKAFKRNGLVLDYDSPEEYLSVFMRTDMMIDGNIKETTKLEMPVATSTDYNAATTPGEKKLFQAYLKVDKQIGLIQSVVYDPETGESRIDQNAKNVKIAVEGVDEIKKAGYITETAAKSLIELNNNNIAMTVAGTLSIGTRNILLDSACFENATPDTHYSNINFYEVNDDSALPSGKEQTVAFTSTRSDGGTISGISFPSEHILGQKKGTIDRISPDKVYTLSFWLKGESTATLSLINLIYAGTGISVNYTYNSNLEVTDSWKKYKVVFQLGAKPTDFDIRFFFSMQVNQTQIVSISSLKLEEGNVATDWTPNVSDIEQSVEAKLELCVKTDEKGNLQSAIHAKANQITIESDNFTLDGKGNMTCNNANITGGRIDISNNETGIYIADGELLQKYKADDGGINLLKMTIAFGEDSVLPGSHTYSLFELDGGLTIRNNSNNDYIAKFEPSGSVLFRNADTAFYSDGQAKVNKFSLLSANWGYGEAISSAYRHIIRTDGGFVLSANRGENDLMLEGSQVWLCGKIYIANYKGINSSRQPLYVNPDGEITT